MPTTTKKIDFDLGDKIHVSPSVWPDRELKIQPGDLSKFAPHGNGVYGYQNREGSNPFTSAPSQEACGGVIYFDNDIPKPDFEALMRIMGVQSGSGVKPPRRFAVFAHESEPLGDDGYLVQIRIVTRFGLRFMFDALTETEYENFPEQELTVVETLWSFIKQERRRWGTSFADDKGLHGKCGGDGYSACEQLAFGIMLENSYHEVIRIWSRAWLVTK